MRASTVLSAGWGMSSPVASTLHQIAPQVQRRMDAGAGVGATA